MKNWEKGKRKRSRQEEWEELQSFFFSSFPMETKKEEMLFPPFLLSRPRTVFNGTLSICSFISCMLHPSSRNLTLLEFLHPSHSLCSFVLSVRSFSLFIRSIACLPSPSNFSSCIFSFSFFPPLESNSNVIFLSGDEILYLVFFPPISSPTQRLFRLWLQIFLCLQLKSKWSSLKDPSHWLSNADWTSALYRYKFCVSLK